MKNSIRTLALGAVLLLAVTAFAQVPNAPSGLGVQGGTSLPPPPPPGSTAGLDWDGSGTVKRGLYWLNPPAMYPMTVLMKKYPRIIAASNRRYATDIFWGNHGTFQYGSGYCNAYWGFHQYPRPNTVPQGNGHWEVAVGTSFGSCSDITARDNGTDPEIAWNTWHSQAFVAQQVGNQWNHTLYVALPSMTSANTISSNAVRLSAPQAPPTPSIMVGQTGRNDGDANLSWGGEPRWEETNGVLRGFQFYTAALSQAQILSRAACDTDACVLQVCASDPPCPWYLNMNPTPSDATDKSGNGHNPTWDGSARPQLWTN